MTALAPHAARTRAPVLAALAVTALLPYAGPASAHAADFPLPPDDEAVIGRLRYVRATAADTLFDIARRHDLGHEEIIAANPSVDPWLPGEGTLVLVPTRFVLPPGPRMGMVVNVAEMRLYFYPPPETPWERRRVVTHPVGVGKVGRDTPRGSFSVVDKVEAPSWTVPADLAAQFKAEGLAFERVMPPGPENPLGDYALILDVPGYAVHGTNRPWTVGMHVSHGCVRLYPEDISKLFPRVPQGTPVRIVDLPYKAGFQDGVWYVEALAVQGQDRVRAVTDVPALLHRGAIQDIGTAALLAGRVVTENRGVPIPVTPRVRAPP